MASRGRGSATGGGGMPGPGGGTEMGPQSAGASLRPGEGAGEEVGGGVMLSGHSRLPAAKTHFHLSGET